VSIPRFGRGFSRVFRSDDGWEQRKKFVPALPIIVDEPARLCLDLACIPAEPASVSPGEVIVGPVAKD